MDRAGIEGIIAKPRCEFGIRGQPTKTLGVHHVVSELVEIIETHHSENIRVDAISAVLELVHQLGRDARAGRGQQSLRAPVVARLAESVLRFSKHRNEKLVDAFLMVSAWNDAELRKLVEPQTNSRKLITERFRTTTRVSVVELLTGFVCCRRSPVYLSDFGRSH